jgi:ATP-dependent Lhr-like helicase
MFSPATQTWFDDAFPAPTPVQRRGWDVIAAGAHALLVAPTGSGKTLAAFLAAIDSLVTRNPGEPGGTRVLYVSPLKALVYDVERNLRAPLGGIRRTAERLGWSCLRFASPSAPATPPAASGSGRPASRPRSWSPRRSRCS